MDISPVDQQINSHLEESQTFASKKYLASLYSSSFPGNPKRPGISGDQSKEVEDLKRKDKEIREHEQSHLQSGGSYAHAPQYVYKTGPDGNKYVVEGKTQIVFQEGDSPEDTIKIAHTIMKAALAPKEPSNEDRRVMAEALRMEQRAKQELKSKQQKTLKEYLKTNVLIAENDGKPEKPVKHVESTKVMGMKIAVPEIKNPDTMKILSYKDEDEMKQTMDHLLDVVA